MLRTSLSFILRNSQTFPFQDDPCSIDNINLGSPNRASNCAALGVPAGYDVNDYITAGNGRYRW